IGEQLARRLHSQGARVVVTDLDEAALTKLGDELGERALTAVADVRDLAALQAVAAQAAERFGGIDTVVANAGIASYGSVLNVDPETFKRVIDVDVIGVFN
ncbi:SDR family oxidoreductase, partial [Mycolicibacter arupensis]